MGTRARGLISSGVAALTLALFAAGCSQGPENIGQPTNGAVGLQTAASPLMVQAHMFHDAILMPIITFISLLVLGLITWIVIRYNKKSNPVPAKWSHNTLVEVIWTVVPVLILVFIALFSFRLLFAYHDMPKPDVTVKVTGNQWNWAYEYPDQGIAEYVSNMLPEEEIAKRGMSHSLYRLAADEPMVVPVGATVRLLVTGADVIHAVALPAFGLKTDAVPGRVNETWFKADRPGIYYGQCSELCGVDHAFMPIQINVVSRAEFASWVASKGGSMTPKTPEQAPGGTAAQVEAGTTGAVASRNVSSDAMQPAATAPAGQPPADAGAVQGSPTARSAPAVPATAAAPAAQ
nr:cytochrome c oxidase subunit II [Brevundimonas alba]